MEYLIFIVALIFIIMVANWSTTTVGDAKIKFKKFKEFYDLNPNRWTLYEDWVFCHTGTCHIDSFHFGLIDYYRYQIWLRTNKQAEERDDKKMAIERMLKAVEQDMECNKEK